MPMLERLKAAIAPSRSRKVMFEEVRRASRNNCDDCFESVVGGSGKVGCAETSG